MNRSLARHGLVILAVLVVVAWAGLIGTTLVVTGGAARAQTEASLRRAESEAVAWSGVRVLLEELGEQRGAMLGGETPVVSRSVEVYRTSLGERAVARLLSDADGRVLTAEAARVNINTATAEGLALLPGVGATVAEAILRARPAGGYQSVGDLAGVEGCEGIGLETAEWLTVFSWDPEVQAGVGDERRRGRDRVFVAGAWSPELAEQIDRRWGEGASQAVKAWREETGAGTALGDYVRLVGAASEDLGEVLDWVKVTDEAHTVGRVDLTRASAEVLATVPGIGANGAALIAESRSRVSNEELRSVTWPVAQGAMDAGALAQCVGHVTGRSLQWRARIEAGFASVADETRLSAAELRDGLSGEHAVLSDRMVLEVVIDAAVSPPRVAYVRDITLQEAWRVVGRELQGLSDGEAAETLVEPGVDGLRIDAPTPATAEDPGQRSSAMAPVGRWRAVGGGA